MTYNVSSGTLNPTHFTYIHFTSTNDRAFCMEFCTFAICNSHFGITRTHVTIITLLLQPFLQPFLRPFFRDHPGEPVPEENFWTLWCKGRLTEADTPPNWLGATPSGLTSAHLHYAPNFLQAGCPSCRPTNSVKALKATSTLGLGRRR